MPNAVRPLITAVLVVGLVSSSIAQTTAAPKTASPEELNKNMTAAMDSMVPMMGRVVDATIEAQLRIAERPETAARIATYKRNLYEALLKKGFTGDQAIQLTIATPLPATSAMK